MKCLRRGLSQRFKPLISRFILKDYSLTISIVDLGCALVILSSKTNPSIFLLLWKQLSSSHPGDAPQNHVFIIILFLIFIFFYLLFLTLVDMLCRDIYKVQNSDYKIQSAFQFCYARVEVRCYKIQSAFQFCYARVEVRSYQCFQMTFLACLFLEGL